MKRNISHLLYIVAIGFFTSCSDFLDVAPKDKVLEEDQYKTEAGIHGALNGLYRQLISTSLYGANLSQTALDAMGHFYTYPPSQPSGNKLSATLFFLCNGRSEEYGAAESIFADIWKSGYNTLLNINYFLKSMEGSTAVIGSNNKDVLMGEAYGLRAYLHFDLFRLFGPRWEDRSNINKILPYSRTTDMILNHVGYEEDVYSTADEYLDYLLEDIREAERLLAADPILSDDSAISKELISDFYKNRNRRMNYYAVKALEARVLQYIGDYKNAAIAAKVVTDQIGEKGKVFSWTNVTTVLANMDYSFFNEVVFGINNPDMLSNYNSFYNKTDINDLYAVDRDNLVQNIYSGFGDNLKAIIDVRARQWTESNDQGGSSVSYSQNGTYISNKFNISANSMQLKTPYFFRFFFFCTLYPNLPRYFPSAKYSPWEYMIRLASLIWNRSFSSRYSSSTVTPTTSAMNMVWLPSARLSVTRQAMLTGLSAIAGALTCSTGMGVRPVFANLSTSRPLTTPQ